ncbi:ATP-dependent metalloprotease [Kwoniella heveanensis CBS 569]|nr:ATP-dependent metalloprotease [Kwoniella heveanensis CBS 569]
MARPPMSGRSLDLLISSFGPRCGASSAARRVNSLLPRPSHLHPISFAVRSLSITPARSGLFSSSKTSTSSASTNTVPTASYQSTVDPDAAPTAFQTRIAELESAAQRSPEDLSVQLALLRELAAGGEYRGLAAYYETIALSQLGPSGAGTSASGSGSGSVSLLKDEEAWSLFLDALAKSGRLGEIASMVRRRDGLLSTLGAASSSDPTTAQQQVSSTPSSVSTASSISSPSIVSPLLSANGHTSPSPSASSAAASPLPLAAAVSSAGAAHGQSGSALNPLYVQMAPPTPQANAWRAVRWLAGFILWGFIILTVMSMIMENTGLLKAGPGPAEFEPEEGKVVKFSDVHGVEEAKAELEEIVEFLKNPEKFSNLGGKLPKGVLLTGPPGTGKTMLARAVAGEAEVPFLFASGSSFDEMFVGVGAKRVRELFAAARKKAPAIVFIDELDAIGSKRSAKDQHYMKQTLNQLLVELDGFEQSEGVIIIAATNFPESLDKALTRPGRFDRHVVVGLPDVRGRIEILKHHMGEVQFDVDVDPSIIARGCPGMSGADLQNLVNQAAVKASREGSKHVGLKHFEWAKDRILMGAERRSHFVTEESKRATAYHEGGHALVALHTPGAMPLHKVTIMPRGQALGITFQLPEQDKDSYTRREYKAMIDVALGGRAAEEMIYGSEDVTSGCSSDLQRATDVAARMIRSYGFSDKVGLVAHGDDESVYLSGKKKDEIESEIRSFLDQSMARAENLLKTREDELHKLANALVEYETLSLDEVKQVLAGQKLDRPIETVGESLKGQAEKEGHMPGQIVDGI